VSKLPDVTRVEKLNSVMWVAPGKKNKEGSKCDLSEWFLL
jgi:hypothetical protein